MQQREPQPIIPPVARELLRAELTPTRKVRDTNKAGNEIYIFTAAECPSLMREIGRLREEAFRGGGGGTGKKGADINPTSDPNAAAASSQSELHVGVYYPENTVLIFDGKNDAKMPIMMAGRLNANKNAYLYSVYPTVSSSSTTTF